MNCHPAPEALPLDHVCRKGEGKPLGLPTGQVTVPLCAKGVYTDGLAEQV